MNRNSRVTGGAEKNNTSLQLTGGSGGEPAQLEEPVESPRMDIKFDVENAGLEIERDIRERPRDLNTLCSCKWVRLICSTSFYWGHSLRPDIAGVLGHGREQHKVLKELPFWCGKLPKSNSHTNEYVIIKYYRLQLEGIIMELGEVIAVEPSQKARKEVTLSWHHEDG